MKVILYMATTANGFIAKTNHDTPWSDEEWESFIAKAKEVGNIVIGRKTYEIMREDGFDDFSNIEVFVLSRNKDFKVTDATLVHSFNEAEDILVQKGISTMLIAGGAEINGNALRSGFVDEVFLDIEPWLFGEGISLFDELDTDVRLKLKDVKRIGDNTIQLHYMVAK